jgi:hypothetical protein
MTTGEAVNAIVNGFVALGTLLLAALAIYGDLIRSWLLGPRLHLILENPNGVLIPCGNASRIYYTLMVVNSRPSAIATNCEVRLKKIWRQMPNGEFGEARLPYPLVMSWPPSEFTPMSMTVRQDHLVDFGYLEEGKFFMPGARVFPNNFDAVVKAQEAMRYGLEIVSDHFVSPKLQIFEVSWNGQWSKELDQMVKNLQIREVTDADLERARNAAVTRVSTTTAHPTGLHAKTAASSIVAAPPAAATVPATTTPAPAIAPAQPAPPAKSPSSTATAGPMARDVSSKAY